MLKRLRIKKEKRKKRKIWQPQKIKTKEERRQEFLLKHTNSKYIANKSLKLRCQITGCREGAITLKGRKKVCYNHK